MGQGMLSVDSANARLNQITTAEELRKLLTEIDISSSGLTTVLYSGSVNGVRSSIIINELKNNADIRLIDNTATAEFLEGKELKDAIARIFNSDPEEIGSAANQFLYGQQVDGVRQPNGGIISLKDVLKRRQLVLLSNSQPSKKTLITIKTSIFLI